MVSYLYESYDAGSGTYINNYQEAYAYVLGNNTQFENYNWNTGTNSWTPNVLYTYSYDGNGNPTYEADQLYGNSGFAYTDQYFYYYSGFTVSGINNVTANFNASIFPNPTTANHLFVKLNADKAGVVSIAVYNNLGQLLRTLSTSITAGFNQIDLSLGSLAAGNYFIRTTDNAGSVTVLNFVKQ